MSSTVSSESAPKSSIKEASGVTCSALTPSFSTIIDFTAEDPEVVRQGKGWQEVENWLTLVG